MTEAKKAAMLLYLNDECKDEGYEIFSDEDFLGLYPAALGVVIAVFGGTFVLLFKKVMEKIYPEVEY